MFTTHEKISKDLLPQWNQNPFVPPLEMREIKEARRNKLLPSMIEMSSTTPLATAT